MSRFFFFCLGMFLTFSACTALLRFPGKLKAEWEALPDGGYRFVNPDLELRFNPETGPRFRWRFQNKSLVPLEIAHQTLALRGDQLDGVYTLWGEKRSEPLQIPPIFVEPGGFVTLVYPVRFNSPLYPFKPGKEGSVWLEFEAKWGRQNFHYRLIFPR